MEIQRLLIKWIKSYSLKTMSDNSNTDSKKSENGSSGCRGLILINTGSGKGKTTAAIGCALRSAGHKHKVLILQYIKGNMNTGELRSIEHLKSYIEILQLGKGFIKYKEGKPFITEDDKKDAKLAYEFTL
ncbi:MAG: cob(I)yrinic acid a,c-diamide adenosyltransferase, partial [Candidatus Humimicrobiaceae bacterium]